MITNSKHVNSILGSGGKTIQVSSQWTYVEIHCDYQTVYLYHLQLDYIATTPFRARVIPF